MKSFTKYFSEIFNSSYTVDLCINCKISKLISDIASIKYQDGKMELGPICKDCYPEKK